MLKSLQINKIFGLKSASARKADFVSAIGLDIGSYSVKCVEVAHNSDVIRLERVSILPLADHSAPTLTGTLRVLLDSAGTKRVRIAVSGPSILIRRISLPLMTPSELKSAIRFQAESHIPFPIDDCLLDFQILGQENNRKTMNVLLVAAKRDVVEERLKLLRELNLNLDVVDVGIFCLVNAFEMLGDAQEQRTYGLLNIGHEVSSFAIIQDKAPFFVREIPFGGRQVTQALMELKGISEERAAELKVDRPADMENDLKAATQKGFEPLIDEIKHSIDYFENEQGEELKVIWTSGGGALSAASAEILSEELGKQVSLWDNTKKMEVFGDIDRQYLSQHSSELNVALGMVLRGSRRKK